jgi:large subunit ribosomal protein L6
MSRIGRLPITVPSGVEVTIDGARIAVSGPKGKLERTLPAEMHVKTDDGRIVVSRPSDAKHHRELHGLTRSLVANMVIGVTTGYRKGLEITGVGYRAQKIGEKLQLNLGYSHPVEIAAPPGISFELENPTHLTVVGIDKQLVGEVAAAVRASRKPEPYKGKGVRYTNEVIVLKETKKK